MLSSSLRQVGACLGAVSRQIIVSLGPRPALAGSSDDSLFCLVVQAATAIIMTASQNIRFLLTHNDMEYMSLQLFHLS